MISLNDFEGGGLIPKNAKPKQCEVKDTCSDCGEPVEDIKPWPEACQPHIDELHAMGWDCFYSGPEQLLIFFRIENKAQKVVAEGVPHDMLASMLYSAIQDFKKL